MGIYNSVADKTTTKFQVWDLNTNSKLSLPSSLTLKQLKIQLTHNCPLQKQILLNWASLQQPDDNMNLEQIVRAHSVFYPEAKNKENIFMAINSEESPKIVQSTKTRQNRLEEKLRNVKQVKTDKISNYEKGGNGRVVFEDRHTAVFASAVSYAMKNSNFNKDKLQNLLQAKDYKNSSPKNLSAINRMLLYLGLLQEHSPSSITPQNLSQKLQAIKSSKQFSDFDPKFVYYIAQIYLKFMIKSCGRIYYIDYESVDDFRIESISPDSKVGIIGDFGTGLKDSIQLLRNMILNHGVDVVLHLGDVYYAGTPQEYEAGIVEPLKRIRVQSKRQIRFYSIPGNHDYYSWGLPFLCFVKSINQKEFHQQSASYFCLRDAHNKWQFLGMDTAYHDSNPLNQVYPYGVGPYAQEKELLWHQHRLRNFNGSTILLTHHPLFSIHERINGRLTNYRNFSCINPMLSAQIFQHLSDLSAWFWGHQHSIMFFKSKLFGLEKGRLLGNSSFHVMYDKEQPYSRPNDFPHIPFIVDDEEYFDQYLPLNPNLVEEDYFGLSYAIIDMGKMCQDTGDLQIEYWCSPSYSDEQHSELETLVIQEKVKLYFNEYKLYQETIASVQSLRRHRQWIKNHCKVYLRCQIGLCLAIQASKCEHEQKNALIQEKISQDILPKQEGQLREQLIEWKSQTLALILAGSAFEIEFFPDNDWPNHKDDELKFTLKEKKNQKSEQNLYLGVVNQRVELIEVSYQQELLANNCIWTWKALNAPHNNDLKCVYLYYGQSVKIYNKKLQKSLSWKINDDYAFPCLESPENCPTDRQTQVIESLWMFEAHNLIQKSIPKTQ